MTFNSFVPTSTTTKKSFVLVEEVFLEKGALEICSKFTGEHPCRSVISIKLLHSKSHFGTGVLL